MQIDEVEVSGQQFQIISEKTTGNTGIVWKYSVTIDGVEHSLGATVTSDVTESLSILHSIDVDNELRHILLQEIRMDIFKKLHPEFNTLLTEYNNILKD